MKSLAFASAVCPALASCVLETKTRRPGHVNLPARYRALQTTQPMQHATLQASVGTRIRHPPISAELISHGGILASHADCKTASHSS